MKKLLPLWAFCLTASAAVAQNPTFTVQSQPVSGYGDCIVDMNGDFLDDIVGVNTNSVNVRYQNTDGTFTSVTIPTPSADFLPGWSIAAGDIDNNGRTDLLYGSGSGVTFMKQNDAGTGFTEMSGPQNIFSQRSNFVDINGDKFLDAFVCHDIAPNVYYINDGAGVYTFHQGGLGDFVNGGNYGSIWVDYDNDGDSDLFIAKCRGGNSGANIDELHRNNGDGTFTNVSVDANMAEPSQSWSSAWGDFDNDGDMDAVIGASSFTTGGHKFRRNNGDGTFTEIATGSGWDTYMGTGHEYIAQDFNNDGFIDVYCAQSGAIMINNGNMTFTPVSVPGGGGPVGDLNNDGFIDYQSGNNIYMNNGNPNKWFKVKLQGVDSNRNGIGARVELHGPWGIQIRDVRSGDGFAFMSSLNPHFGIGSATEITKVVVKWPSGIVDVINNPSSNQSLFMLEGANQLNVNTPDSAVFSLYPNPTRDILNISFSNATVVKNAEVYDMTGKMVLKTEVTNQKVNVHALASGTYIVLLQDANGKKFTQKFIRQ